MMHLHIAMYVGWVRGRAMQSLELIIVEEEAARQQDDGATRRMGTSII
jgi:hypothetical protein